MFWFWAMASMFGYALQNALMARYVRTIDPLSASFYRNVTFFVSFLPLFLFVSIDRLPEIILFWKPLAAACILASFSQWTRFLAFRYLPIGIASAGNLGFTVIFTYFWAYLYLSESLSVWQVLCLGVILAGSLSLSIIKSAKADRHSISPVKGLLAVIATGFIISLAFVFLTQISRNLDPFLAAYFWETGISLVTIILLWGRFLIKGKGLEPISWPTFWKIFWCASPTLLGTIGFMLAVNSGSLSIVSAISAVGVLVITVLGVWMYQEKLGLFHYLAIGFTIFGVIALRLATEAV